MIKAWKAEFFILWFMVIGSYRLHLGDLIIKRFNRVLNLRIGGNFRCGGLITIFSDNVFDHFPPTYLFFANDSFRLTLENLRAMHIFRSALNGHVWMCGRSQYLRVTDPSILSLVDPIGSTKWVLASNLAPSSRPRQLQQNPPHSHPDRPSSSTVHPYYVDATPI